MAIKLAILFLGVLLLAQASYSAPVDSAEKVFDELADILKGIGDRVKILEVTLDELIKLDEVVKEKGKTLLNKVLEDPKILEVKNDVMEKFLKEVREYRDKLEKEKKDESDSTKSVLEYLSFEDLVDQFKKEKVENLGNEAAVIGTSLKENGLEELEKTVLDHFSKFTDKFVELFDGYAEKLSDEDKKDEKILLDWYNKFVNEKELSKKLNIFDDFFVSLNNDSKEKSKED